MHTTFVITDIYVLYKYKTFSLKLFLQYSNEYANTLYKSTIKK